MDGLLIHPHVIRPLALAVLLIILVMSLHQSRGYARRTMLLFTLGLLGAYSASLFAQLQSNALSLTALYLTILASFAIWLIGMFYVYRFFEKQSVRFRPDIASGAKNIQSLLSKRLPGWSFFAAGIGAGLIEPLQHYAKQDIQLHFFQSSPSVDSFVSLLGHVVSALLVAVIIWFTFWHIQKKLAGSKKQNSPVVRLLFGVCLIGSSWLLVALAATILRI